MFTTKDLGILYRCNYEAYRNAAKRLEWVKAQDLPEVQENTLIEVYEKEMSEYLDMKLKIDRAFEMAK